MLSHGRSWAEGGFGATEGLAQGRNPAILCSLEWRGRWEAGCFLCQASPLAYWRTPP